MYHVHWKNNFSNFYVSPLVSFTQRRQRTSFQPVGIRFATANFGTVFLARRSKPARTRYSFRRSHTKERPFKCPDCDRGFTTKVRTTTFRCRSKDDDISLRHATSSSQFNWFDFPAIISIKRDYMVVIILSINIRFTSIIRIWLYIVLYCKVLYQSRKRNQENKQ